MASPGQNSAAESGTAKPTNDLSGNRRGSSSGALFSGLMSQKRGSLDAAAQARRQSFHDTKPAPGFIGKMWHNFVAGSPEK